MHWSESETAKCRHGEVAWGTWPNADIIAENSVPGDIGYAALIAQSLDNGWYFYYEWWYGHNKETDRWSSLGYDDKQIEKEMRKNAVWFETAEELLDYIKRAEEMNDPGDGLLIQIADQVRAVLIKEEE